jgi:hypothetical protein
MASLRPERGAGDLDRGSVRSVAVACFTRLVVDR